MIYASLAISALFKEVTCQASRRVVPYKDPRLDLVVDIFDADAERIGTGFLDNLDDSNCACTALWITE